MKARRAAIYARVSTAEQVEGTSLDSQVAQAEALAAGNGWHIVGRFVDEGVSGAKARRPALDALMVEIRAGTVEVVVVAKLDRIGRSMRHLAALLGDFDDLGVQLVSVSEAFDSSTPAGRLQRNMLASFAEFEREQIRDRLSTGRDAVIRRGKYVSTVAPFGYRIETDANHRRLVIDPVEAESLRVMIDLFVNQRMTTGEVATELNARGFKPRNAPRWYGKLVRILLRNPGHLSGTWTWRNPRHGYTGAPINLAIPAIIDEHTLERLRTRFAETSIAQTHRTDRYLLSGRIRTPHGTVMYGFTNPGRIYRCKDVFANNAPPDGRTCECKPIRAEHVEEKVWGEVCNLLADPDRLLNLAGLHLSRTQTTVDGSGEDLSAIDRRITKLEKAAGEKLSRMLADGLDPAIAGETAKQLGEQLEATRRHRKQVAAWQAANTDRRERAGRLVELAEQARQVLPVAGAQTKARILALLEVRVQVLRWETCPACAGIGYISKPAPKTQTRPGRPRGNADKICPQCRRQRALPVLSIEGMVPEAELGAAPADSARWPFRLAGGQN